MSQFTELYVIYQIAIVAISVFMVAMLELGEKMMKDLMKTLDKLLNVKLKLVKA